MFCENCGKEIANGDTFCAECGTPVTPEKKEMDITKYENKVLILILMIFGGEFGLHNFVFGEVKKGVIRIVFAILFGGIVSLILGCIDAVKIVKGTYVIDPEAFF